MPAQRYERVRMPPPPQVSPSQPQGRPARTRTRQTLTMRYTQVADHDDADVQSSTPYQVPTSPPPSFHSRASSPSNGASHRLLADDPLAADADRTLADTFDTDSEDDEDSDGRDDRQRLMRGQPEPEGEDEESNPVRMGVQRRVTQLPVFNTQAPSGRVVGSGQNDGVFANLSAKPTRGEDLEEKPPVRTHAYPSI
jgi:hypothetical protein